MHKFTGVQPPEENGFILPVKKSAYSLIHYYFVTGKIRISSLSDPRGL